MSVKMIAEFRRKPSRKRQIVAQQERNAELDRIVKEELRRAWYAFDPGVPRSGVVTFRDGKMVG